MKKYLLNSVAHFDKPDDQGSDPEAARKATIEAERAKVNVTVKAADNEEEEGEETKQDEQEADKKSDEDDDKDGDGDNEVEETEEKAEEAKESDKIAKKIERLERKLAREAEKRRAAEKHAKSLEARLTANPDTALSAEDVEALAEKKANEKALLMEFNAVVEKLADESRAQLKMTINKFNKLIDDVVKEIGEQIPGEIIGVLGDLNNGASVFTYLLQNVDEFEDIYKLRARPTKLGLELAKLSIKIADKGKVKPKPVSQVPDAPEPISGKSAGSDRLAILATKKNLTQDEMTEYVQARNAEIAQKRKNGRMNLR